MLVFIHTLYEVVDHNVLVGAVYIIMYVVCVKSGPEQEVLPVKISAVLRQRTFTSATTHSKAVLTLAGDLFCTGR